MKKGYLGLQVILYKADRASSKNVRKVKAFRVSDVDEYVLSHPLSLMRMLRTVGTQLRLGS